MDIWVRSANTMALEMTNKSCQKLGDFWTCDVPFDTLDILSHSFWASSRFSEFIKYFQQHELRREMTEIELMVAYEQRGQIQENEVKRPELVDVIRGHLLDYQGPTQAIGRMSSSISSGKIRYNPKTL